MTALSAEQLFAVSAAPRLAKSALRSAVLVQLAILSGSGHAAANQGTGAESARVEFIAQQTRISEARVLDEIMGRLGRIETTTRDLRDLIEAMPVGAPAAPPTTPVPTTAPAVIVPKPAACPPSLASANAEDDEDGDAARTVTLTVTQAGLIALLLGGLILGMFVALRRRAANPVKKGGAPIAEVPLRTSAPDEDSIPPWMPTSPASLPAQQQVTGRADQNLDSHIGTPPAASVASPAPLTDTAKTAPTSIPAASNSASASLAEVFDPTLELAEIMLSMGMASGAAQALEEHIRANPREALMHWLKLLEVYRKDGHRSDFEKAAEDLQKNFNIRANDWLKTSAETQVLEDFPRVINEVVTLWPQPQECLGYLYHLLEDNREGMRMGFPQSVAEEILILIAILKAVHHIEIAAPASNPALESV